MSRKDHSDAVEELLSQANDLHVLEQVSKINLSAFPDDSVLPTNLETRFRRLKSLPASSSQNLLTSSKRLASFPDTKNRGNVSLNFSRNLPEKSRSFNTPIVRSRSDLGESSNLRRIGSSSTRFSRSGRGYEFSQEVKTTQTEKHQSRISSTSLSSGASTSQSSHKEQKPKSKAKLLISWFEKLSLGRAMGCLRRSPDQIYHPQTVKENNFKEKEELRKREEITQRMRDIWEYGYD